MKNNKQWVTFSGGKSTSIIQQIEEGCQEIKKATGVFPNELRINGRVYKLRPGYYEKQLDVDVKAANGEKRS